MMIDYKVLAYASTKSKATLIDEGKYIQTQHKEHEKTLKRVRAESDGEGSDGDIEERKVDQDSYQPPQKKVAPPPPPQCNFTLNVSNEII